MRVKCLAKERNSLFTCRVQSTKATVHVPPSIRTRNEPTCNDACSVHVFFFDNLPV